MANHMDFLNIKEEIKKLVADITEVPIESLTEDAKFAEDLGVDSMRALEIVASIEKKYKVIIPEREIPTVRALSDIYKLLEKILK
jgi:acyl carrier protein